MRLPILAKLGKHRDDLRQANAFGTAALRSIGCPEGASLLGASFVCPSSIRTFPIATADTVEAQCRVC